MGVIDDHDEEESGAEDLAHNKTPFIKIIIMIHLCHCCHPYHHGCHHVCHGHDHDDQQEGGSDNEPGPRVFSLTGDRWDILFIGTFCQISSS